MHPGFVDAHYHAPNQLTRGVFPDTAAMGDYYLNYARWYERMDADDEHASALSAGLEMLRSGVTCFMEAGTVFETDAVARGRGGGGHPRLALRAVPLGQRRARRHVPHDEGAPRHRAMPGPPRA